MSSSGFLGVVPVLPTSDMLRDVAWYERQLGFEHRGGDAMYAVLRRDKLFVHLQWHADTEDDPLLGGSVIKFFVPDIQPVFDEMVERGTVALSKLRMHTDWGTHEFGCYDPNRNAIFFVQDV